MGKLRDRMIEEMNLTELLSSNAEVLRSRGVPLKVVSILGNLLSFVGR